jgi:hypothetical protein
MESTNRMKLGKIFQTGILLEIFSYSFNSDEVYEFLEGLKTGSRSFFCKNKS